MTDILRNNWFVVLIAIIIIGFMATSSTTPIKIMFPQKQPTMNKLLLLLIRMTLPLMIYMMNPHLMMALLSTICIKMPLSINLSKLQKI